MLIFRCKNLIEIRFRPTKPNNKKLKGKIIYVRGLILSFLD